MVKIKLIKSTLRTLPIRELAKINLGFNNRIIAQIKTNVSNSDILDELKFDLVSFNKHIKDISKFVSLNEKNSLAKLSENQFLNVTNILRSLKSFKHTFINLRLVFNNPDMIDADHTDLVIEFQKSVRGLLDNFEALDQYIINKLVMKSFDLKIFKHIENGTTSRIDMSTRAKVLEIERDVILLRLLSLNNLLIATGTFPFKVMDFIDEINSKL